jgi:hypothetical protein
VVCRMSARLCTPPLWKRGPEDARARSALL